MQTLKMLLAEIGYRKLHFFLSLFAVGIAVTLFVAGPLLVDGYGRETDVRIAAMEKETAAELAELKDQTRRLMRDMGFNLLIVHRDTNMSNFWASDFASHDMPVEYVDRLASDPRLKTVTHLVATLQAKIDWRDRKVLLVGYLPEVAQSHMKKKKPMGYDIEPGTVFLGHELIKGVEPGDKVEILGEEFRVVRLLPEYGSKRDITIAMHLDDAQRLLEKPGRINQILALGCHCAGADLAGIRNQLSEVLPEARITEFRSIALARAEQRDAVAEKQKKIVAEVASSRAQVQHTLEMLAAVVTPVVVVAAAIWVGLLALANVRQRRVEIGVLRAIGKGSGMIALLFLGKAVLIGLLGGLLGALLGTWLAQALGTQALEVAAVRFHFRPDVLAAALLGAPLLSAAASYLPTLTALMQDPANVLRDA
jgi:hypothetical protein